MMTSPTPRGRSRKEQGRPEEWAYWLDRIRQLPMIRVEKVVAVREALRDRSYDSPTILDVTIDRLCADML